MLHSLNTYISFTKGQQRLGLFFFAVYYGINNIYLFVDKFKNFSKVLSVLKQSVFYILCIWILSISIEF